MTDFAAFNLNPKLALGVREMGYAVPTPIQSRAIPPALEGRDVLGLAQTGTGKTAAFALPILERLLEGPNGRTRALVLAPTRELAEQIHESFRSLGRHTGLRSMTVYGGVGMAPQVSGLRRGTEIVVACPGRLLDHFGQRTIDASRIETLVLDEADRMFDMGFLPDIRKILSRLPGRRQNLLFSATMPPQIRGLADEVLRDPIVVQVDHAVPLTTVTHALYPVPEHLKSELLSALLRRTGEGSVLVFTRTKHRAKRLAARLHDEGCSVTSLQGNLSQNKRKAALEGFRSGKFTIMVATDIAARGLDISQITHVINYDVPDTTEAYTHRIGRTGRAARTGDAFTFVTPADEPMVRAIERALGRPIQRLRLEGFDYGRTQHQQQQRPPERRPRGPAHSPSPSAAPGPQARRPGPLSSRSRFSRRFRRR